MKKEGGKKRHQQEHVLGSPSGASLSSAPMTILFPAPPIMLDDDPKDMELKDRDARSSFVIKSAVRISNPDSKSKDDVMMVRL